MKTVNLVDLTLVSLVFPRAPFQRAGPPTANSFSVWKRLWMAVSMSWPSR